MVTLYQIIYVQCCIHYLISCPVYSVFYLKHTTTPLCYHNYSHFSVFSFSAVFRKSEFSLYPFYSKKKGNAGGVPLTRKPSFGNPRPFLHQYEVKGQIRATSCGPNSVPSSPTKVKGSGFKRSLSFGAGSKPVPLKTPPLSQVAVPPQRAAETAPEGVAVCATPNSQMSAKSSKCVVARQCKFSQYQF